MKLRALALLTAIFFLQHEAASAREPQWWGVVVARGADQDRIRNTHILQRPYRPLHFYGNTMRRQYYRGNPFPTPRDVTVGTQALLFQREPGTF